MDLKRELLNDAGLGLVESDFDSHYSDLYVRAKPGVLAWLRDNYEFYGNVRTFVPEPGTSWNPDPNPLYSPVALDIPFANNAYFESKVAGLMEGASDV